MGLRGYQARPGRSTGEKPEFGGASLDGARGPDRLRPMRLAPFIQANMETILVEWEAFAQTLYPPAEMPTPRLLRDHAQQILAAVVKDLSTLQTMSEQSEKSMGRAPEIWNAPETAAQTHAVLRAQSGIDINQLAAE